MKQCERADIPKVFDLAKLEDIIKDFDYVMHEAFCLDSEEQIFHAYEKNHSVN